MGKFNSLRFIFEDEFRQKWEDGRDEGHKEGRKEGREERDLEVARKLLSMKLNPNVVAEGTGLPLERVQSLALPL